MATTITSTVLDQIEATAAAHHAAEAQRNAPKPTAIRAVYSLVSAMRDLSDADYDAVSLLLAAELAAIDAPAD